MKQLFCHSILISRTSSIFINLENDIFKNISLYQYGIINISESFSLLVFNLKKHYFIFNCYCCTPKGHLSTRGFACLITFISRDELTNYFYKSFEKIGKAKGESVNLDIFSSKKIENVCNYDFKSETSFNNISYLIKQIPFIDIKNILKRNVQPITKFINQIRLIIKPLILNILTKDIKFKLLFNKFKLNSLYTVTQDNDIYNLYKSISRILFGINTYFNEIKISILFVIIENEDYFKSLIKTKNYEDYFENWIENLTNDIIGNKDFIIQAASMLCARPIFVFYNDANIQTHLYQVFNDNANDKFMKCPLCLIQNASLPDDEFFPCLNINFEDNYLKNFDRFPIKFDFKQDTFYTDKVKIDCN